MTTGQGDTIIDSPATKKYSVKKIWSSKIDAVKTVVVTSAFSILKVNNKIITRNRDILESVIEDFRVIRDKNVLTRKNVLMNEVS